TQAAGKLQITDAGFSPIAVDGFEKVLVVPANGADTVTVNGDLTPAGVQTLTVNLAEDSTSLDTVNVNLLDNTQDTLVLSGANAPSVASNQQTAQPAQGMRMGGNSSSLVPTTTAAWAARQTMVISAPGSTDQVNVNTLGGNDVVTVPSLVAPATIDLGA